MPENPDCKYADAIVSEVSPLPSRRIKLQELTSVPGDKQSFLFVEIPPGYRNPQKGDHIRLEFRRTVDPLPAWSAHLCDWPGRMFSVPLSCAKALTELRVETP